MLTTFNRDYIDSIRAELDKGWVANVFFVTDAELTVIIESPCEQLVRFVFVKGRVRTTKYINGVFCATGFDP